MDIEKLKAMKPILKIQRLCELANLNYQTIFAKIKNSRELKPIEANLISEVLKNHKLEERQ